MQTLSRREPLRTISCVIVVIVSLVALQPLWCQERTSAPRADGQQTPMTVYRPEVSGNCAPLAVISHGAGGSEMGYRYLAEALAREGFTAVVMGHRESGLEALRADILNSGIRQGVRALVTDRNAEQARLIDVGAVLKWADAQCRTPFRVLLGHSMGAETVMLEAGAKNIIGVSSPPAGLDRFDAYVALSPEGPGIVFPEHAWSAIRKPLLVLTGTRDQSLQGGPEARQLPWQDMPGTPGQCQWMGVIDGATHMNFAGSGMSVERVEPMVTATITDFLARARRHDCGRPPPIAGMTLQSK
jgi:predicted dienelactone hydrolase